MALLFTALGDKLADYLQDDEDVQQPSARDACLERFA